MGNHTERKRAKSRMGTSVHDELEEARAALRDKENEPNLLRAGLAHATEQTAEKQRTIDAQKRTIDVQHAAQEVLQQNLADAKLQAEKDLAAIKHELQDVKQNAQRAKQEAQQAKLEAQQAQDETEEAVKRAVLAEKAAEATESRLCELERRAAAAERIADAVQANVGRALGTFHKMADFGLAAVKRDHGSLSKLETTRKFLIANQARVKTYGVQIVREDANSRHLDVLRYSLLEGTESSIRAERDDRSLEAVGEFVPTADPDKIHAAFIEGGEEFVRKSSGQHEIGVVNNVQRSEASWLWTSCLVGNRYPKFDFENALTTAVVRAAAASHDVIEELTESLEELRFSVMVSFVDIRNMYEDLKSAVAELPNE